AESGMAKRGKVEFVIEEERRLIVQRGVDGGTEIHGHGVSLIRDAIRIIQIKAAFTSWDIRGKEQNLLAIEISYHRMLGHIVSVHSLEFDRSAPIAALSDTDEDFTFGQVVPGELGAGEKQSAAIRGNAGISGVIAFAIDLVVEWLGLVPIPILVLFRGIDFQVIIA